MKVYPWHVGVKTRNVHEINHRTANLLSDIQSVLYSICNSIIIHFLYLRGLQGPDIHDYCKNTRHAAGYCLLLVS